MANVTAGYNWVSGEVVTPAKMNSAAVPTISNIVDADIGSGAAIALSKLATGALPAAITVANANIVSGVDASKLTAGTLPIARIADAAVTPAKLSQPYTLDTAKASTSGTSIDFTDIPSWAKRITVMFNGVSTNGTSAVQVRIGNGTIQNSGYIGSVVLFNSGGAGAGAYGGTGFDVERSNMAATSVRHGHVVLTMVSANVWVASGNVAYSNSAIGYMTAGNKSLSGTLDLLSVTTVNGTDTFDAGTINISYEG